MWANVVQLFDRLHTSVFEAAIQPLLFYFGWLDHAEFAYDAVLWLMVGAIEIAILAIVFLPMQKLFPAEPVTDRRTIRTDFFYTVLHRLGLFGVVVFLLIDPLVSDLKSQLSLLGMQPINIDQLWPGVTDVAWVSFFIYLVVLDFFDYWIHRGQHRLNWWWQLHALHHSQKQMTLWSDNRNHLIDDLIRDVLFALIALIIGVAPGQFILIVVLGRGFQSVQHANLRWQFHPVFERFLVSPSFHRLHHAIGYGHEGKRQGCNFGVLFTVWDQLFRSADFMPGFVPTGIRDQNEGREYGNTFAAQQILGLKRLIAALAGSKS